MRAATCAGVAGRGDGVEMETESHWVDYIRPALAGHFLLRIVNIEHHWGRWWDNGAACRTEHGRTCFRAGKYGL